MTKINLVLFGVGNVGSTLINHILDLKEQLAQKGEMELNIPVVANSTTAFLEKKGIRSSWKVDFEHFGVPYKLQDILDYVKKERYENLVAVDCTASEELVNDYSLLVKNGFHLVAANKIANTLSAEFYNSLRKELRENKRQFLYETNVGAGLPVVEIIKNLHRAGEKVVKIRGVFSGSLSYIFNTFSNTDKAFDEVIQEAGKKDLQSQIQELIFQEKMSQENYLSLQESCK